MCLGKITLNFCGEAISRRGGRVGDINKNAIVIAIVPVKKKV